MLKRSATQRVHLKVALHREHLGHRVGNWCTGGEDNTASFISGLYVLDFEKEIECALGGGLWQTGNSAHLCDVEQILEPLRLIDEEPIDSEFFECERVVFLAIGGERFELCSKSLLHALQLFHESRAAIGTLLANGDFDFIDLCCDEISTRVQRDRDFFEARMCNDDGIPIPGCNPAEQTRAVGRREVFFSGSENVSVGIKGEQFGRKLREHVIWYDEHRLCRETEP